ncbi:hypothetical protein [Aeromicrobium stalagmiti]|uniref:hypothetical protein n=1 Tax=Aeromicrobium stalagmiti TaxID=2738988 RepID=UPI0015690F64|nr:hypothetical protein [Aeromicrobium stalagmiti]NRQ50400.1 hypothetical protein [Aeromicrobium stalagmiti]
MSNHQIGPVKLLTSVLASREDVVVGTDGSEHEAWIVPAVVVGPHQTLLEIELRRWSGGGEVVTASRGDSHPYFQRLVQGCRLGIRDTEDGGAGAAMVGIVEWDVSKQWASVKKASLERLGQAIGASARDELVAHGVDEIGTRKELWGDSSPRQNFLEARFDPDEPVVPLAIYVMTRVLPVLAAVDEVAR